MQAAFFIAGATLKPASIALAMMPSALLASQSVEDGLETTTFALLAASANAGKTISLLIGEANPDYANIDHKLTNCVQACF